MKNRFHDKKAGIFITSILFFISLTETIIRGVQPNYSFVATELGQTFSIAIFSAFNPSLKSWLNIVPGTAVL